MPVIERIVVFRDTHGAEPRFRFSVPDKQALRNAIDNQPGTDRPHMFAQLLTQMSSFSGLNLPPDWKEVFLSGEPFTWEFTPDEKSA